MKEYTLEELRENPISGFFWTRDKYIGTYNNVVRIHDSCVGWCKNDIPLGYISDRLIFYGPLKIPPIKKEIKNLTTVSRSIGSVGK